MTEENIKVNPKIKEITTTFQRNIFGKHTDAGQATHNFFRDVRIMKELLLLPEEEFQKTIRGRLRFNALITGLETRINKEKLLQGLGRKTEWAKIRLELLKLNPAERNTLLERFDKMSKRGYGVLTGNRIMKIKNHAELQSMVTGNKKADQKIMRFAAKKGRIGEETKYWNPNKKKLSQRKKR